MMQDGRTPYGTKTPQPAVVWHWLVLLAIVGGLASGGCAGHLGMPSTAGPIIQPPPQELQTAVSREPIRSSDVIQVRLGGDNTATLTQSYRVAADGTIELTGYGKVVLAGKTVEEAQRAVYETMEAAADVKQALELSRSEYYLVSMAADGTKNLSRAPYQDGMRVKDAIKGLSDLDRKVVWIARPGPGRKVADRLLPVDWEAISRGVSQTTNYPLQPGDWVFVAEERTEGMARLYGALTGLFTARRVQ